MSSNVKNAMIFLVGIVVGAGFSWSFFKNRCEKLINENEEELNKYRNTTVKDVEDAYINAHKEELSKIADSIFADALNIEFENDEVRKEYEEHLKKENYTNNEEETNMGTPYIITADQYDECNGYQKEMLTYYADHALVDDFNNHIEDTDFMVGIEECEIFKYFDSDKDPIFIRNDYLKIDFEIDFEDEYFDDSDDEDG